MRRACGEVQNRERLRVRDSYTVLGCVRQPLAKLADGPRKSRDKAADGKSDGYGGLKDDKYDDCKYAAAEGSAKLLVNRLAAKLAYKNGGESPEKRRKKSNKEFHTHPPLKIKVRKQNVMTTINAVKYSPAFSF